MVATRENQAAKEESKHQTEYREKPAFSMQIDILPGTLSAK